MPPKTIATKLRENLAYLRSVGASREEIMQEIARAKDAMDRVSAEERKLSGAEKVAAVGSKVASGATFGFFDELSGDKDVQRYLQSQLSEENPTLALGAEIAGGLAVPGSVFKAVPSLARGASTGARLARHGRQAATVLGEGAVQGGVSAIGNTEGSLEDRLRAAPEGAAWGAGLAGGISGTARGVSAARRATAARRGVDTPTLDEMVRDIPEDAIARARTRYSELEARGLGDEAKVVDVLDDGEGLLRAQRTANKDVAKTIDSELRSRSNRLANLSRDRFAERTGTERRSLQRTERELADEAQRESRPFYEASEREALDRQPVVEELPAIETAQSPPKDLRTAVREFHESKGIAAKRGEGTVEQQRARRALERHAAEAERPAVRGESRPREIVRTESGLDPTPPDVMERVRTAVELPSVKEAIERVRRDAPYSTLPATDHRVMDQAYKEIGEDIRTLRDRRASRTITVEERRELKRLVEQRKALRGALKARSEAYGTALDKYADPMGRLEAAKLGAQNTPADVIPLELSELADDAGEVAAYKQSKANLLFGNTPNPDLGEFARFSDVIAPVANVEKAATFRALWGDDAYREYLGDILEMAKMQRLRAGAGESTTVDKMIEQMQANPDLMEAAGELLRGNVMGAARRGMMGMGLDRLLSSKRNAQENASLLLRGGRDVPRTLDDMVRIRSLASEPYWPALLKNRGFGRDWLPTRDLVKNAAAREAGAVVGRRRN